MVPSTAPTVVSTFDGKRLSNMKSVTTKLRVASLNLRAYPNTGRAHVEALSKLLADEGCDIVLLQECRRPWLALVCQTTGLTGYHAHTLAPAVAPRAFSPDGCAIAISSKLNVIRTWRIAPEAFLPDAVQTGIFEELPARFKQMPDRLACRYSGRSILAELELDGERFVAVSFHATPGTGKVGDAIVGEWKPFFHGAVALELSDLNLRFVFAMDANEPLSETVDSVRFHWDEERSGVKKMKALLGTTRIHRGRDLFRDWLESTGSEPASSHVLFATYAPTADFQRRFDSMWATSEFGLSDFTTDLESIVQAGGDHALLAADLQFDP